MIKFGRTLRVTIALAAFSLNGLALAVDWKYPARPEDHIEQLNQKRWNVEIAPVDAFIARTKTSFEHADVKNLEISATQAGRPDAVWPSGLPKLSSFLTGIDAAVEKLRADDKKGWEHSIHIADRWQATYPASPYAQLCKTRLQYQLAWRIRGADVASDVPPQAMGDFEEKIHALRQRLLEIKPVAAAVLEWYAEMANVNTETAAGFQAMTELVDEALPKFPAYSEIYEFASRMFLPKWGGSDEKFAAYTHHVETTAPTGYGPMLYARIYYYASCCDYFDGEAFSKGGAEWDILKQGLEDLRRRYPDNFNDDREAYFACTVMDAEVLPGLMDKIGNSPDPRIWKYPAYFRGCQHVAMRMKQDPHGSMDDWRPN